MDIIEYAAFRYDKAEVENGLYGWSGEKAAVSHLPGKDKDWFQRTIFALSAYESILGGMKWVLTVDLKRN